MSAPLELVRLGESAVRATRLAVGTGPIGGLLEPVSDADAASTLERAWDHGVRFFDTAPLYGRGIAEERLGSFVAGRAGAVVSTKVGRVLVTRPPAGADVDHDSTPFRSGPPLVPVWDWSAEGVRRSLAASLERLGLERVDVVLLHDLAAERVDEALAGAVPALAAARERGEIGALGAGTDDLVTLERLASHGGFDCFLVPGRFSLADAAGRELLDGCAVRGVTVIAASVFAGGLLADPLRWGPYRYAGAGQAEVERALAIERVCARHGVPLAAAAMQFPLRHPAVGVVLVGVRTPQEVDADVAALRSAVPDELWEELGQLGLLPAG